MKKRTWLVFAWMVIFLQNAFSQTIGTIVKQRDAEIDNFIETEMKKRKIPGLALGIADAKGFVKHKAYGLADVQNEAPVRLQTAFELASITKQFTAGAIMLLVQEGKIKITDPLNMYIKECPATWNNITIRHLLCQCGQIMKAAGLLKSNPTPTALSSVVWAGRINLKRIA